MLAPMPTALRWASLGATAVAAGAMAATILEPPGWYWAWAVAILAVVPATVWTIGAAFRGRQTGEQADDAGESRSSLGVVVVVLIALAFGLLSMFTRLPDSDDSFLVNRSLWVRR